MTIKPSANYLFQFWPIFAENQIEAVSVTVAILNSAKFRLVLRGKNHLGLSQSSSSDLTQFFLAFPDTFDQLKFTKVDFTRYFGPLFSGLL